MKVAFGGSDGDRRGIGQLRADVFLALLSGTSTATESPADTTRRQVTETPARHDAGWTGVDDAVADAIAQAARDQLTELPDELAEHDVPERHDLPGRDVPERYQRLAELIAQAGECIADSLTRLKIP